jgi:hypothetical protein
MKDGYYVNTKHFSVAFLSHSSPNYSGYLCTNHPNVTMQDGWMDGWYVDKKQIFHCNLAPIAAEHGD